MRRSLIALVLLSACGGSTISGDDPQNDGATTSDTDVVSDSSTPLTDTTVPMENLVPCEVESIVTAQCGTCHGSTPKFGAPMALVTREDFMKASPTKPDRKVWEEVKARINLPADTVGRMPQKPNPPLDAASLATMNAWLDGGSPARSMDCAKPDTGPVTDTAPPVDGGTKPLSCTPDIAVRGKSKWAMPKDTRDIYTCYGFDYPSAMKKHIIGIAPKIDNPKIVHHVLLMQHTASVSGTPTACSEGSIARYRMLYGWAPGVGSFEMPAAAGLPAESGTTHFVVQIHYNNVTGLAGELDDSGFDLCSTSTLRPNDADIMAFGSRSFTINPKSKLDITASWTIPGTIPEVHAIGAFPHMHQLGKKITTTLHKKAGGTADLGSDLAFDFNNQYFDVLGDVVIKSGDTVKTNCVWENPTDRTVRWGENTDDEMCFSFTMYYPKVTSSLWSWGAPAFLSSTTVNP
jgi:hypothetical protein